MNPHLRIAKNGDGSPSFAWKLRFQKNDSPLCKHLRGRRLERLQMCLRARRGPRCNIFHMHLARWLWFVPYASMLWTIIRPGAAPDSARSVLNELRRPAFPSLSFCMHAGSFCHPAKKKPGQGRMHQTNYIKNEFAGTESAGGFAK